MTIKAATMSEAERPPQIHPVLADTALPPDGDTVATAPGVPAPSPTLIGDASTTTNTNLADV
jgi:hypothetical protein